MNALCEKSQDCVFAQPGPNEMDLLTKLFKGFGGVGNGDGIQTNSWLQVSNDS